MKREEVFNVISGERDYQEGQKRIKESHVVEDFPLSSGMEAIRYNLDKSNKAWYTGKEPYSEAMDYIRKIAAICVQMGEQYGMPKRY
ncbi:MAG: hypothetical protein KDH96_03095 [Candidatus Riesia sp.]|nr:hypothetical protein [Candidatus Riesia sp.]